MHGFYVFKQENHCYQHHYRRKQQGKNRERNLTFNSVWTRLIQLLIFCPKAHPNVDSLSFFYNRCALILLWLAWHYWWKAAFLHKREWVHFPSIYASFIYLFCLELLFVLQLISLEDKVLASDWQQQKHCMWYYRDPTTWGQHWSTIHMQQTSLSRIN